MDCKRLALAIGSLFLTVLCSSPAVAELEIVQTGFQRVSEDPPLIQVEFYIVNQDPFGFDVCDVTLIPMGEYPYGACAAVECGGPEGFGCWVGDGRVNWSRSGPSSYTCIEPGQQNGPFTFVHGDEVCCYSIGFMSPVLEWYAIIPFCFETDQVVQNHASTWGRIKVLYR